jgi:glycosyltransferase involved in cell wall biosynthesis
VLCLPSHVGGIPDLITTPALGRLVPPRATAPLAEALIAMLAEPYDQELVAMEGRRGDWQASARALHEVLLGVAVNRAHGPNVAQR